MSVLFSLWSGEIIFCYVQEAEDEEDPSNLQLAWEMLEVAKIAYSKQKEVQNFSLSIYLFFITWFLQGLYYLCKK